MNPKVLKTMIVLIILVSTQLFSISTSAEFVMPPYYYPIEGDQALVVVGDVDGDGEIVTKDVRETLWLSLDKSHVTSHTLLTRADTNDDYKISTQDARKLLLHVCELSAWSYPIGAEIVTKDLNYMDRGMTEYEDELAQMILEEINKLRIEEGTKPAVWMDTTSHYSKIRSEQLVSNFGHIEADQRIAAEAAQVGAKVILPSGETYFRPSTTECCGALGNDWTDKRAFAKEVAEGFLTAPPDTGNLSAETGIAICRSV